MVIHTKKQVKTKTIHKRMNLPQSLRDKIDEFWKKQVKVNPNLFNGEVWNVTKMEENKDNILLTIEKTDYAHYLYDERHGIEEKYACHNLAGGTYIVTKDGYAVIGELDDTTSYPRMMQVSGGGIDEKYDIVNGEFDLILKAYSIYSKNQLEEHFNKYYQFLEETDGEKEFKKLHFLKLGRAVEELDKLDNPKRLYVRQLLGIEDKGVLNNE